MVSKSFAYKALKLSILPVLIVTVILIIPASRLMLLGLVRQESFYKGRPISYWINTLKDENVETRKKAAYALGDILEPLNGPLARLSSQEITGSVSALIDALNDEDITVRRYAASALATFGSRAETAVSTLIKSLTKDEDAGVRADAAHALSQIGSKQAIPALEQALSDKDGGVRVNAGFGLWSLDRQTKEPVKVMVAVLEDKKEIPGVRRNTTHRLGLMGRSAESAIPTLLNSTKSKDELENVRTSAIEALGRMPTSKEILSALEQAAKDPNPLVRKSDSEALTKYSGQAR